MNQISSKMQTFDEKEQNQQFLLIRKQMNENIIFLSQNCQKFNLGIRPPNSWNENWFAIAYTQKSIVSVWVMIDQSKCWRLLEVNQSVEGTEVNYDTGN